MGSSTQTVHESGRLQACPDSGSKEGPESLALHFPPVCRPGLQTSCPPLVAGWPQQPQACSLMYVLVTIVSTLGVAFPTLQGVF